MGCTWVRCDINLWPPKSDQFFLYLKGTFEQRHYKMNRFTWTVTKQIDSKFGHCFVYSWALKSTGPDSNIVLCAQTITFSWETQFDRGNIWKTAWENMLLGTPGTPLTKSFWNVSHHISSYLPERQLNWELESLQVFLSRYPLENMRYRHKLSLSNDLCGQKTNKLLPMQL